LNFSFKEKREIKIDFSAQRITLLKDKIVLYGEGNIYFIDKRGEIIFSIPVLGFEKGKISEFFDFTIDGNNLFILGREKVVSYNSHGEFLNEFYTDLPRPFLIDASFPFGIFVFDKALQKVIRYDFDGRKKGEFYVKSENIKDMDIDESYIYFYDEKGKMFVYNFYGNKVKEFKLIYGKKIEVEKGLIFLMDGSGLKVFDEDREIYSERIALRDIHLKEDNLYILSENIEVRRFER